MRRQHRIECLQKIRKLRVVVRRRRDLCTTRHFAQSKAASNNEGEEVLTQWLRREISRLERELADE
jgi:hypothetical protein